MFNNKFYTPSQQHGYCCFLSRCKDGLYCLYKEIINGIKVVLDKENKHMKLYRFHRQVVDRQYRAKTLILIQYTYRTGILYK